MNKAKHSITVLSYGLIACFALSFLAQFHWIPALITHFYIQMSFIALLLTPFLIKPVKNYHLAFIMIMITVAGYAQTRLPMQDPWAMSAPPAPENSAVLKVAQYNKYHKNKPFDLLPQWLEENQIEVLVMQEVTTHDVIKLKEAIRPVLPYTLPPMPHRPGHAIVFSKYPLENLKIHKLCETTCYAGGIHFQITLPAGHNVSIYTVHTDTPIKNRHYQYQSEELLHTGKWIAEDHAKNILFIGDINSTPYSPPFKMFKELSGLNYQFYGLLPANTWPSFLMLPVLKIPIDHVLFSDALTLLDIHRAASHGSDHHSLIATFAVE